MAILRIKDIKDKSVQSALQAALKDDGRLSHEDVVELVRSTLDGGAITNLERDALQHIASTSKSISDRSKRMLQMLVNQYAQTIGAKKKKLKVAKPAANAICDFLKKSGTGKFPNLDRDQVGVGLLMRIANPGIIRQGSSSLCGPSSLLFNIAKDKPLVYANFGIDLFVKGRGQIGKLNIEPGADVRRYKPGVGSIDHVDWLTAASIRDSENWFFDYESVKNEVAGITMPNEVASWFKKAGYNDVHNKTNVYFTKGKQAMESINRLFDAGYRVCLFISANMLSSSMQNSASTTPDHWVVLTERISAKTNGVSMKVFTWGKGNRVVPTGGGAISETDFQKNFYGFVAAKP